MTTENKYCTPIGYLNFKVETKSGTKSLTKFGLTLVSENPLHLQIAELMESEQMTSEDLLALLSVNFVSATKDAESDECQLAFTPKPKAKLKAKP